jgi:hypothetical protein
MDPALDLEARRLFVSAALTTHAVRSLDGRLPADAEAQDLLALSRRLGAGMTSIQRRYRLRFEPPYPGLTAGPEAVGEGYRIVLACRAFDHEERPLGVVFTTLIPGRLPQVSVAPAEAGIPEDWRRATDAF